MAKGLVLVGRCGGAFGVRGEVRIRAYGQDPLKLLGYGPLLDERGRAVLTLADGRAAKGELIARASEVGSKEEADALKGLELHVPRHRLPATDDDEFYLVDLVGLKAVGEAGEDFGTVKAVHDFGAGDILEIEPASGPTFLLAFTRETAPEVRLEAGQILIVLPQEAG